MTRPTQITQAEMARAVKVADATGKVAVVWRGAIIFARPEQVALPSPESAGGNTCDGIWGTGSSP